MTRAEAGAPRGAWAAAAASFVVAALAMLPVLRAGFHPEDFGWLALARLSSSPWPLLAHNIDFVYFYRPLPLLLWWLGAHLFGTDAGWHNAIDVSLHALNAALVCLLAARMTARTDAGIFAGVLFASLPAAVGTAAWMSDRFDTVALGFSLLAFLAFERALQRRRMAPWAGLWMLCALLSKEVAYATAAVMFLRLAIRWRDVSRDMIAVVVAVPAIGIALRMLSGTTVDASLDIADPLQTVANGFIGWWRQAPSALGGFLPAPGLAILFGLLLMALALSALRAPVLSRVWPAALTGTGLLLLPAALQSPVTAPVLVHDASIAFTENLRFYYMAGAGLALLLAAGYASLRSAAERRAAFAVVIVCVSYGMLVSHRLGSKWADDWRAPSNAYLMLGDELGQYPFPAGCRIWLDAPELSDAFHHHADTIVKATAPPAAPVQTCAIFTDAQVYQTLVPADRCTTAQWPGLKLSERHGLPIAGRVGDVCMLQFLTYAAPEQLGAPLFRFHVGRNGHAQEVRD